MKISEDSSFDPETVTLLRTALDAAWDALPPERRVRTSKSDLAVRLLRIAAQGERDPIRLRARAVLSVVAVGP
jgi:hypothetical protein